MRRQEAADLRIAGARSHAHAARNQLDAGEPAERDQLLKTAQNRVVEADRSPKLAAKHKEKPYFGPQRPQWR